MRIGVVILPQFRASELSRRWRSLQDRGFAHGWCYDHLAWRDLADEDWYATVPGLVVAALSTTDLGIGTWVASPNFRHPVPFAKELLSLDDISDGRIIAAIGAGGLGWDARVLGSPELSPKRRVDRLEEFAELTDLLLRNRETSWQGQYFTADRARMNPAGARSRVQMIIAGNGPRSVRLAAKYDGWATTGPAGDFDGAPAWWRALATLVDRFETAGAETACAERETAPRPRYLDLDSMPGYSFTSVDCFLEAAGRAAELGFTDAVVHWPRPAGTYAGDETVLDRIADRLRGGDLVG